MPNETPQVIRACIVLVLPSLKITPRVPPTCFIHTASHEYNQQPTTNNQQQQPTTNNQQQQPTTNNQQPTTNNNQQPTTNNQQPTCILHTYTSFGTFNNCSASVVHMPNKYGTGASTNSTIGAGQRGM
jgi:hypothetical protein